MVSPAGTIVASLLLKMEDIGYFNVDDEPAASNIDLEGLVDDNILKLAENKMTWFKCPDVDIVTIFI